jgi:hypothetical protein
MKKTLLLLLGLLTALPAARSKLAAPVKTGCDTASAGLATDGC